MQSSKKQKKPVPKTPVKKNKSVFGASGKEIHSPVSNILQFEEDPATAKMMVRTLQGPNNKYNSEFEVIKKLGEGSFGEAFMVRSRRDGKTYAIKKSKQKYIGIRDRESKLEEVFKALKITNPSSLTYQSPQTSSLAINRQTISTDKKNIGSTENGGAFNYAKYCVKFYEAWEESGYLYIMSEACEKGNLDTYLVELENQEETEIINEDKVWKILFHMACAVKHVHDQGFIHLDIKPSNFFVKEDGTIKLGDFGLALSQQSVPDLKDDDVEGDSIYMAPELLL